MPLELLLETDEEEPLVAWELELEPDDADALDDEDAPLDCALEVVLPDALAPPFPPPPVAPPLPPFPPVAALVAGPPPDPVAVVEGDGPLHVHGSNRSPAFVHT